MCHEGGIVCGVVCNILMASDRWLETLLKSLVDTGGGLKSLGCMGMAVGNKSNRRHMFFGYVLVWRG